MMNFLYEKIKTNFLGILSIIISLIIVCLYFFKTNNVDTEQHLLATNEIEEKNEETDENLTAYKIDIKGAVKKPGVYELPKNSIINDAINVSGGLTNKAFTDNINLSKKITDEMVIFIYTKSEYNAKRLKDNNQTSCEVNNYQIDSCIETGSSIISYNENASNGIKKYAEDDQNDIEANNKISINTATIDDLTALEGIGEAKAQKIIDYRNNNGNFKSIDEIKNISGIGDSIFEKIKEYITI